MKRNEPIKSEGKRKKELEKTIAAINNCYESYKSMLGNLNPNDKSDKAIAASFFESQTQNFKDELNTYMTLGYNEDEALKKRIDELHSKNLFKLQLMPCFKPEL